MSISLIHPGPHKWGLLCKQIFGDVKSNSHTVFYIHMPELDLPSEKIVTKLSWDGTVFDKFIPVYYMLKLEIESFLTIPCTVSEGQFKLLDSFYTIERTTPFSEKG